MRSPLLFIDTHAGRIQVGATVRSTRYDVKGLVTHIAPTEGGHRIEVNGRHSDFAQYYELLAAPDATGQAIIDQAGLFVAAGG